MHSRAAKRRTPDYRAHRRGESSEHCLAGKMTWRTERRKGDERLGSRHKPKSSRCTLFMNAAFYLLFDKLGIVLDNVHRESNEWG